MDDILTILILTAIGVSVFAALLLIINLAKTAAVKNNAAAGAAANVSPSAETLSAPTKGESECREPDCRCFTLTRSGVLGHIAAMRAEASRFSMEPTVLEDADARLPDFLLCGNRIFGIMFERNEKVFHLVLRLSDGFAAQLGINHPLHHACIISEKNWYGLIIDQSFEDEPEVYGIIEESYRFTLAEFYSGKVSPGALTAEAERLIIEREVSETLGIVEKKPITPPAAWSITRKAIADHMRALENPDIQVIERAAQPQLPTSLRYKEKTFAMLHGTDQGVLILAKIPSGYASELTCKHPGVDRARFPNGTDWYSIPVDSAFDTHESVYAVLEKAQEFAQTAGRDSCRKTDLQLLLRQ